MKISESIDLLCDATAADGRSQATINGYRSNLRYLVNFLGDVEVEEITVYDLRSYAASLHQRDERYADHAHAQPLAGGLSLFTIASYIRSLKRLFNFLQEDGLIEDNPAKRLKIPKGKRTEPKAVKLEDFEKLLAVTAGGRALDLRNRAILLFLADTGCRVGGLVGLKESDLHLDELFGWVTEKGEKPRQVYFTVHTADAVRAWLQVRPDVAGGAIFINLGSKGDPVLSAVGIRQALRRLSRKAQTTGPTSPHSFRHAFAREFLIAGGDLASLSQILGHASIQVTAEFYAVFVPSELAALHARYSPLANFERVDLGSTRSVEKGDDNGEHKVYYS